MSSRLKLQNHNKRRGTHRQHGKDYKQVYWPYLPLLSISFIIFVVSLLPPTFSQGKTLGYSQGLSASLLLQKTNDERQANDKDALKLSERLNEAAQAKATDMVNRNYWSHQTPEGKEPWVFIDSTGYTYLRAGENLAYGFRDSKAVIQGWIQSTSHRENLLGADFTEAGFGFANATDFQNSGPETVVVALYAKPVVAGAALPADKATPLTLAASESQKVTKAQTIFGVPALWSGIGIGMLGGLATAGITLNHNSRLRRYLRKGERYFASHPLMDISLILLIIAAFNFSRAVGYIH